jgi:hypothetical protein
MGTGCPLCKNKTELKVLELLKTLNVDYKPQFRPGNCRRYYDFYIPEYNLIIEIDGPNILNKLAIGTVA